MDNAVHPTEVLLPPVRPLGKLHGGKLVAAAPAKINLNLLVAPRRADGYHDLDSIVVKVSLCDVLTLRAREDGEIGLTCEGADCGPREENLAYRAAALMRERHERGKLGVEIHLLKRIPPGQGLGGGSSDAATMLAAAGVLWRCGFSHEVFHEMAAKLGSDVPLFLGPAAARMTGRGAKLRPTVVHPFLAVLHMPPLMCPTKAVYAAFDAAGKTEMGVQLDAAELAGQPPSVWRGRLVNQLAEAAMTVCPPLREVHRTLQDAVAQPVCVTGSGSAMFVLCDDYAEAQQVGRAIDDLHLPGTTLTVAPNPW
jgi:4-diphosphocytidyl-2-C-methyl-D-erythritol kinase